MTKPLTLEQKKKNAKARAAAENSSTSKSAAQKSYDAESKKNEKILDKAKGGAQPGLPLTPGQLKLSGFDGSQLKATTPLSVQVAANTYFDCKSDVEKAKDKVLFALGVIESEMKAAGITVCVVRSMGGESMTCRIKSSSKLEIKRMK